MDVQAKSKGRYIIVGAGYGGLATALELNRKGFEVEIFEAAKELTAQGLLKAAHIPPIYDGLCFH